MAEYARRPEGQRHGRSLEAERRAIPEATPKPKAESFPARATRLRATTPPNTTDSTALIRAARDGAAQP